MRNRIIFHWCQNTLCEKELDDFEIGKQINPGKVFKSKYRFCKNCRKNMNDSRVYGLLWRCWKCGEDISQYLVTKIECDLCHNRRGQMKYGTIYIVEKPSMYLQYNRKDIESFPPSRLS